MKEKGFFIMADGTKSTDHKPKKKKAKKGEESSDDEVKPKKAQNPYNFFMVEHSEKVRKEKGISVVEAMKESGVAWNALDDAKKEKYN
jgi:hypothetical protein